MPRFRELVLDSLKYSLSVLASEGVHQPKVVVFGGAVFALEIEGKGLDEAIYRTRDIDLVLETPADLDEINLALLRFRRAHTREVEVVVRLEARMVVPLRRKLLPVEFVRSSRPRIQELFRYTYQNAKEKLGELDIHQKPVTVYLAELEDSILCKLVMSRKKDIVQLRRISPHLDVCREYMREVAKRFGIPLVLLSRVGF